VIATATNTVVATVVLPRGANVALRGVAVSSRGTYAYVTYFTLKYVFPRPTYSDNLGVINTATNTVVGGVSLLGQEPVNPRYIPQAVDGAYAYVANWGSNNVSVIATSTNSVVATVPVGANPRGVGIIP
jgi:YVTN family beta-propeller protein